MSLTDLLDRIEATATAAEIARLLRAHRGSEGLSAGYARRVVQLAGSDPARARLLASAWRSLLAHGDEPGEAHRVRAIAARLRGQWRAAAAAFLAAGEATEDPVRRAVISIGAVDSFGRAGEVDEALAWGNRLARRLARLGERHALARLQTNVGNALLWADRYAPARRWLARADANFAAEKAEVERAVARLALSTAELYGGYPARALDHAQASEAVFRDAGLDHYADLCRLNLAHGALIQGRPDDALDFLEPLAKSFVGTSPADAARTLEFLGDAYHALNLHAEAEEAFIEANDTGALAPLNAANCQFGIGLARLAQGRPAEAFPALRRAFAGYERVGNMAWASAVRAAMAEAYHRGSKASAARGQARAALIAAQASGSPYHEVSALLALCEVDAQTQPEHLDRAENLIRRTGQMGRAWRVEHIRARSAPARRKGRHYRRMFERILEARMLTRSTTSRATFLNDKQQAVEDYLAWLLRGGSAKKTDEALGVIRQVRSVSLVDEILNSPSLHMDEPTRLALAEIRTELAEVTSGGETGIRLGSRRPDRLTAAHRRWIALTRSAQSLLTRVAPPGPREELITYAQVGRDLWALTGDRAVRLDLSVAELQQSLKRLQFELAGAMLEPDAPGDCAIDLLAQLRKVLVGPLGDFASMTVAPDGALWGVPWLALSNACLTPTPLFGSRGAQQRLGPNPRVAIWANAEPDLPSVERELGDLLARFPHARVCTGLEEIRQSWGEGPYDLLHVAGHGVHRRANPMFSSLRFRDGSLTAAEIAVSPLRARLVTLSACEAGAITAAWRHEPDGLARAFLARGAEALVSSAWLLNDDSAADATAHYLDGLQNGSTVLDAALQAQAELRRQRPHPYYWAWLTVFSGYTREVSS